MVFASYKKSASTYVFSLELKYMRCTLTRASFKKCILNLPREPDSCVIEGPKEAQKESPRSHMELAKPVAAPGGVRPLSVLAERVRAEWKRSQHRRSGHANLCWCSMGSQPWRTLAHRATRVQRPVVVGQVDGHVHGAQNELDVWRALQLRQQPKLVHLQSHQGMWRWSIVSK